MGNRPGDPILLVFSDDWGRHPSSSQHQVGHHLERYRVLGVNTIGTRRPSLDLATLKRGYEKIRQWSRPSEASEPLPDHLRVLRPKMWPWLSSQFDRKLNRELLHRQLSPLLRSLSAPVIAITTIPIVADLVGLLPVQQWVYYCVDDFSEWPGLDRQAMLEMEEKLVRKVDQVVAVSDTLQRKMGQRGRTAPLLTHGVDLDFWKRNIPAPLPQLEGVERPLVTFWGVVDRRMDVGFVQRLSADLSRGTILLVGPDGDPDPALLSIDRVVRVPPLPFSLLPRLGQDSDVLIMPYADLPVTRAIQPLKLKEYLATGKPVVVRDLPATHHWVDSADLASTPEDFSRAVRERLETGLPAYQSQARERLSEESWQEKARLLETWILGQESFLEVAG